MRLEPVAAPTSARLLGLPVAALALTLAVGTLLAALAGANPLTVFALILKGAAGSRFALLETLNRATPLIFTGPGIPKGETQALAYLLDIFPTVCDFAGTEVPSGLDGKSLKPVIEGKSSGVRDTLFLAYRDVQRAVRDSRYKLLRYPQVNITQLFDLQSDPHELTNLADKPEQAERIKSLTADLQRWQKSLGDTTPLVVTNPQSPAWDHTKIPDPPPGKGKGKKQP